MLLGGAIIVFGFSLYTCLLLTLKFYEMGIVLALFGTIIPPMLLKNGDFLIRELVWEALFFIRITRFGNDGIFL